MSSSNGPSIAHSYSNEFRRQGMFCDVQIKVGDRSFPCHRIVLASAVKYFRDMFTQNYAEAQRPEVELKGVNADDFELLLNRIYSGSVILEEGNNAYRLLRISHYLHLESLEDLCAHYTANIDSIPLDTVINIYKLAGRIGEKTFMNSLAKYLAKNFITASKTASNTLLRLSGNELLKIFLQPDFITAATTTLDFLTSWLNFQSDENQKFLLDLLNAVNLESVPKEWLVKIMTENSNLLTKENKRRKEEVSTVEGEVDFNEIEQLLFDEDLECSLEDSVHKDETKLPFVLYTRDYRLDDDEVFSGNPDDLVELGKACCINRYKFENSSIVRFWDLNFKDSRMSFDGNAVIFFKTIVVDRITFIFMDHSEMRGVTDDAIPDIESCVIPYVCSDLGNHRLTALELPNQISNQNVPGIASIGVQAYVHLSGLLHVYNCEIDCWYDCPTNFELKTLSSNLLSYNNNSLYAVGGRCYTHSNCQYGGKHFQHYDVRQKRVLTLENTKYAHIRSASCIYNDKLYVTGGACRSYYNGYIECYDFRAGKWDMFESSLPWPKFDHTMLVYDNKFWFFGGSRYQNMTEIISNNLTWCFYDMNEHKWSDNMFLPAKVHSKFVIKHVFDVAVEI